MAQPPRPPVLFGVRLARQLAVPTSTVTVSAAGRGSPLPVSTVTVKVVACSLP